MIGVTRVDEAVQQCPSVNHVLVVTPETPRWRKVVEGDVAHDVRRKISKEVTVERVAS